jgi:hypothetical protein
MDLGKAKRLQKARENLAAYEAVEGREDGWPSAPLCRSQ